jgi:hypothetical protein
MAVIIHDRLPQFKGKLNLVLDDAFREGSRDILIKAKTKAPFLKGGLRKDTDVSKVEAFKWRVSFWSEYARYQEFGGDSKRRVRRYSTAGTGSHYLKNAGDEIASKFKMTVRKHTARVR